MRRRSSLSAIIASAVIASAITTGALLSVGGGVSEVGSNESHSILATETAPISQTITPAAPIDPLEPTLEAIPTPVDWAQIYAIAVPSLVSITTDAGAGSGFFVSQDGHVITNLHVVVESETIVVVTRDGKSHEAELIARDVGNDLALLKIDPSDVEIVLPAYGSLENIHVGDPVGALGAPFQLPNTLTVGIVSGLGRLRMSGNQTSEPLRNMIQTDASLNPGNSGGMLVNARGQVIGIPTQIQSPDRVSSGIGFAVSADAMLRSLPTLLEGDDVERSYLGVSIDQSEGRLEVSDVNCDSPADRADLRDGDIILAINGEPAATFDLLTEALASVLPGEEFTITVRRGLRELTVEATAGVWPTTIPDDGCG